MNQEFPTRRSFPEHWLYWTFRDPGLLKEPLYTTENKRIKIIDAGHINYDNGPDIQNATLEIEGIIQKGDIEFHIFLEDWFKHGHHEDRRYQNVILHVLWDAPNDIEPVLLRRFHHLILSYQIRIPIADWKETMALMEYDRTEQSFSYPDATQITDYQIRTYAQIRFERKVERFRCWLKHLSLENILIIALAEALGYSKNKFPFRQLIWENPPSTIFRVMPKYFWSPVGVWLYLAMRAGILSNRSFAQESIDKSAALASIHHIFMYFSEQGVVPILELRDWYFSRLRPVNNPIIRLAALSQIIHHYHRKSLFTRMLQLATERLPLKKLLPKWQVCLRLPIQENLIHTIRETCRMSIHNRHTIGLNRINQFITNSVLPVMFLWAERAGNYGFQYYIEELYENIPACEDSRVIRQIASKIPESPFNKLAVYQQGLYELLAKTTIRSQQLFEPTIKLRVNNWRE